MAVTGNQPSFTPKMSWARLPITNIGMEITIRVLTVTRLSTNFPRRIPARIPAEIPITISMMIAIKASLIVVGNRMASSSTDRCRRRSCRGHPEARCPCRAGTGRSRLVQVVLRPELGHVGRRAGSLATSPGHRIARQSEDHDEDDECDPMMTGIICSSRRTMYLPMRHSSRGPRSDSVSLDET